MQKRKLFLTCLLAASLSMFADNTSQTVKEVTGSVTLDSEVDYHISSTTPFTTTGSINITNTDHATVIFDNLLPSKAVKFLSNVMINGEAARNGSNCQVRIYNAGAMILPYSGDQPLTVFTEADFGGESSCNFTVNTKYNLTSSNRTWDNKIRSFILKRGYMVCLGAKGNGTGYSRVFIADKADKEINLASVSKPLNGRVSYIRISKWNDVIKRGWAGFWNDGVQEKFNTGWCYNWDASDHRDWVDREYVTQHHHEGWPGIADVGEVTGSANILGNNEPDNKADDKEQDIDVKNVLANWPQMMATGRRLGSPAVAGDYNWLYEFIDSVDARGWRCDFIAVHAYWYKDQPGWKSQLESISKRCGGRPIWITEMNYGANWTGWPGSDTKGTDANYAIELQHMGPVLDYLNDAPYIERYAFYNNVQDCRYAIAGDKLTPIGEKYANLAPKMAYNSDYEYVPRNPRTYDPSDLTVSFVPRTKTCSMTFKNHCGEFVDDIMVERRKGLYGQWECVSHFEAVEDTAHTFSYQEKVEESGNYFYRIHVIDFLGRDRLSSVVANTVNGSEGSADFQWGTMSAANDEDVYSFYEHGFESAPAVVFGGTTSVNPKTHAQEVVNAITTSYFTSKFFPWNALDSDPNDLSSGTEHASFIVAKPGNGTLGSLHYETGLITDEADKTVRVGGDTIEYKFKQPFAETPVVFVTPNSTLQYPVKARAWKITKDGFKVVLTRQVEASKFGKAIVKQRVSFFAIEKGSTTAFDKIISVGNQDMEFTSTVSRYQLNFGKELNNPKLIFQYQSFNRPLLSLMRLISLDDLYETKSYANIKVFADTSDPNKTISRKKPLRETVGWMAISDDPDATGIQDVVVAETPNLSVEVNGGMVNIRDAKATAVAVYTSSGAKVVSANFQGGEAHFDLSSLPAGILVIKANSGKFSKLVIRR